MSWGVLGSEGTASPVPPVLSATPSPQRTCQNLPRDVAVPVWREMEIGDDGDDGDISTEKHQPSPSITSRQVCVPWGVTDMTDALSAPQSRGWTCRCVEWDGPAGPSSSSPPCIPPAASGEPHLPLYKLCKQTFVRVNRIWNREQNGSVATEAGVTAKRFGKHPEQLLVTTRGECQWESLAGGFWDDWCAFQTCISFPKRGIA